jgi:hypothetical protein
MFLRFPSGSLDHLACLGAVDIHLFRTWKNPYGPGVFEQLAGHRVLLSDHKPFLGITPTLTDHDRRKVLSDLHLTRSSYMQLSNRRLDLTYVFAPFYNYYALADILGLIPDHLMDMPRTLIYCKNLHELNEVRMFLITVTMSRWPKASCFVAAYHASLNEKDKGIIEASFRSGRVPVVVATSAFGAVSSVSKSSVEALPNPSLLNRVSTCLTSTESYYSTYLPRSASSYNWRDGLHRSQGRQGRSGSCIQKCSKPHPSRTQH